MEKPDLYPITFTFVKVRGSDNLVCASVLPFALAQVVQALIDVFLGGGAYQSSRDIMDTSLSFVGSPAFYGRARAPVEKFSQRLGAVVSVPFVSARLSYDENSFWVRHVVATYAFIR